MQAFTQCVIRTPRGTPPNRATSSSKVRPVLGAGRRDRLWDFLAQLESRYAPGHLAEGIVFHHPDGRRAKIKRKDFPRNAAAA